MTELTTTEWVRTERQAEMEKAGIVFLTKSLPPHVLERHKAHLGLELEVLSRKLDRFGWDSMDAAIRTRLRSDWMNALADFTIDEVQEACRIALRNKAKDALNEETIAGIVLSSRARIVAALPKPAEQPTERKPIDKEAADRILAEAGFAPKKFGTI